MIGTLHGKEPTTDTALPASHLCLRAKPQPNITAARRPPLQHSEQTDTTGSHVVLVSRQKSAAPAPTPEGHDGTARTSPFENGSAIDDDRIMIRSLVGDATSNDLSVTHALG